MWQKLAVLFSGLFLFVLVAFPQEEVTSLEAPAASSELENLSSLLSEIVTKAQDLESLSLMQSDLLKKLKMENTELSQLLTSNVQRLTELASLLETSQKNLARLQNSREELLKVSRKYRDSYEKAKVIAEWGFGAAALSTSFLLLDLSFRR